MSLAEMFIQNKGEPLNINGSLVVMSHRIGVIRGQEVEIEFISCKNNYRQGIEVSLDKRIGYVEVNGQKPNSPVFWRDTAPSSFVFKCFPKKNEGQLNIWNIWQYSGRDERVDAWIGNAGIIVHPENQSRFLFRCSNGIDDIDFADLVFRVTLH